MAVAAADFYTYARATGTPLPKTKQEEAKLTPAVNQWKNNQLRRDNQRQEGINPGAVAGLTGLAGVGALALAATRGGLRQRVTEAVKPSPGSRVSTGVGGLKQDLGKVTKGRGDTWGEYKESIAPKTKIDERDFVNEAIAKVEADAIAQSKIGEYTPQELTALENRQKFIKTKGEQVRKELVAEGLEEAKGSEALSSNDFLQQQGPNKYIDPEDVTLSPGGNVPKSETVNDQTLNAIDAAEDQQTGRVNQQLQRNEDLDQSQIALMEEIAEDQDRRFGQGLESGEIAPGREYQAPIDEVAQSLPDGAPVIQSEQRVGVATRPTAQELLDKTKGEIIRVEGPQGQVRYAETRPQPSWVGASSTIPTNEPNLGPNLAESPVGQRIATARKEIIDEQKAMGVKKPKPSIIETELSRQLGKQSHSYGGSYTKLKNQMKLGIEDPRFLTDLDQETKYVGGVELPIAVRNVFDNTATGSRQLKEPYIKPELAQKADIDFRDKKEAINTYWGNAKLEVYQELNPLIKQTDALLEEQNMLLYSLNNQGPSRELSERLGLVNRELKTNQRNINFLENRLSGIERTQTGQLEDTKKWVPQTLTDWKGEGTVVRPKPLLAKNKEFITDEGDSLSSLNQATQRVTDVGPEDLEIVPGGLLTGGYPKLMSNIPTNVQTGNTQTSIKPASGTSVRGMGGTDLDGQYVPLIERGTGGEFVSKYIGSGDNARERLLTKGGNILPNTPEAATPPTIVEPEPVQRAGGGFYQNPQYQEARPQQFKKEATPNSRETLQVTDALRKIQTDQSISPEARKEKAQDFLAKIMSKRGVSSASGTFSPLR